MAAPDPQILIVGTGDAARSIAYRAEQPSKAPAAGLFWLSGFMSDMTATKATAIAEWAAANGLSSTRFDYSGHGASGGGFTDGTIGRWLEEAADIFARVTSGPQIVIGSSMGGYIAVLLLKKLLRENRRDAERIKALVLIAPAWDMTEELMWNKFPDEVRREIIETGRHLRPSAYAAPYTITRNLIEDGRKHLLARATFDPGRPVIIIQGVLDPDVPIAHTRELMTFLAGGQTRLIEIPDGEHRLSRPQDIDVLFSAIRSVL